MSAQGGTISELVETMMKKDKYVNPYILIVECDTDQKLEDLIEEKMNTIMFEIDGSRYEITDIGEFTGVVDSKTTGRAWLMSENKPFVRVQKSDEPDKFLNKNLKQGKKMILLKIERVPYEFDPVEEDGMHQSVSPICPDQEAALTPESQQRIDCFKTMLAELDVKCQKTNPASNA